MSLSQMESPLSAHDTEQLLLSMWWSLIAHGFRGADDRHSQSWSMRLQRQYGPGCSSQCCRCRGVLAAAAGC